MHDDIYVHFVPIPGKVNEAVSECSGGYSITIDPRQSDDGIKRSFDHAMRHIKSNDFEKDSVQEIEAAAHRKETP